MAAEEELFGLSGWELRPVRDQLRCLRRRVVIVIIEKFKVRIQVQRTRTGTDFLFYAQSIEFVDSFLKVFGDLFG